MTDITLEQRARELLAEVLSIPVCMVDDVQSVRAAYLLEAMTAALRLSTGADWVLVPREPTPEMLGAFYRMATGADWCPSACNLTKRQLARARKAYAAMLAAAPRHETGEGQVNG